MTSLAGIKGNQPLSYAEKNPGFVCLLTEIQFAFRMTKKKEEKKTNLEKFGADISLF